MSHLMSVLCSYAVLSQFTNMLPSILEDGDIDFQVRRTHLNTLKVKYFLMTLIVLQKQTCLWPPSHLVPVLGY